MSAGLALMVGLFFPGCFAPTENFLNTGVILPADGTALTAGNVVTFSVRIEYSLFAAEAKVKMGVSDQDSNSLAESSVTLKDSAGSQELSVPVLIPERGATHIQVALDVTLADETNTVDLNIYPVIGGETEAEEEPPQEEAEEAAEETPIGEEAETEEPALQDEAEEPVEAEEEHETEPELEELVNEAELEEEPLAEEAEPVAKFYNLIVTSGFGIGATINEVEPNDTLGSPGVTQTTLSATGVGFEFRGTIDPENDRDYFEIQVQSSFRVFAAIDAQAGGSELDAFLTITDTDGVTPLVTSDDQGGSLDPVISIIFPRPGSYFLIVEQSPKAFEVETAEDELASDTEGDEAYEQEETAPEVESEPIEEPAAEAEE